MSAIDFCRATANIFSESLDIKNNTFFQRIAVFAAFVFLGLAAYLIPYAIGKLRRSLRLIKTTQGTTAKTDNVSQHNLPEKATERSSTQNTILQANPVAKYENDEPKSARNVLTAAEKQGTIDPPDAVIIPAEQMSKTEQSSEDVHGTPREEVTACEEQSDVNEANERETAALERDDRENEVPAVQISEKAQPTNMSIYSSFRPNFYNSKLRISVLKSDVKVRPDYHLSQLLIEVEKALTTTVRVELNITFILDDGSEEPAVDCGGPSRNYLGTIFEGVVQSKELGFRVLKGSSLTLPHALHTDKKREALPSLDPEERISYYALGQLFMFCYSHKKDYYLGKHVAEALFKAVLSLSSKEINTPFKRLSHDTHLKICRQLAEGLTNEGIDLRYLIERLDWAMAFDQLDDAQLSTAAQTVLDAEFLPDEYTLDNKGEEPNLVMIKQNREEFKQFLFASIYWQKGRHGQLGAQLAPIQEIARGMKSFSHLQSSIPLADKNDIWNIVVRQHNPSKLSDKIQGLIDRDKIANSFVSFDAVPEITKKLQWLQEWIRDDKQGATEEELKKLMQFVTGVSSIPYNIKISVVRQYHSPIPAPKADTCNMRMALAPLQSQYMSFNDHTKSNFIQCLRKLVLVDPDSFTLY